MQISETHLDHIEHLLAQSMNGIHLLFDHVSIAKVLRTPTEEAELFKLDNLEKIQNLFSELVERDSFADKRDFIESLDTDSYELLLRTYFHIVDNSMYAASTMRH